MARPRKESRLDIERRILKNQIKEELSVEMEDVIYEKIKEFVSPAIQDSIREYLDFPLTVKQVARMTGRTETNIYKMCQRAQIPYSKVGSQIHINLRDVNKQLLGLECSD